MSTELTFCLSPAPFFLFSCIISIYFSHLSLCPTPLASISSFAPPATSTFTWSVASLLALPGFNPMWEETLVFTVHMPELALVRFLVWDHDPIGQDFIGQRTIAFHSMMPGRNQKR